MLRVPAYDLIAEEYIEFVLQADDPTTILGLATQSLIEMMGDVSGQVICDLGCGEGHLSRTCREFGAAVVIGVDISMLLLAAARRSGSSEIVYVCADGQNLEALKAETFDLVVSNLALMDMADLAKTYQAVYNVLKPGGGRFVFSITHPCFQAPQITIESNGRLITQYATEGQWFSEGIGIRAKVGAYHRTMATYINLLVETGFIIERVLEPTLPPDTYPEMSQNIQVEIPAIMVMKAAKQ
ncbi:MAG: methyltransferase domain-containing protein [Chloroflexi bacterium]|nr:methyltransferase domain-containing protein [Chloroflexota bacterium]